MSFLGTSCGVQTKNKAWDPVSEGLQTTTIGINRSEAKLSPAIAALIKKADQKIEKQQWLDAISILERALRINSKEAQAWTRMAAAYLGNNNPEQALHMAKRSNSYARENRSLKSYNWLLISRAYKQLNQLDAAVKAEQKSNQLK